jgi:photosystem II stability/assembly factor-like uncharacterized protein
MRTIFILFVFLATLSNISNAQNNSWTWGNPLPQGNTLNSIAIMPNSNKCVIVGNAGTTMTFNFAQNKWSIIHGVEEKWQNLNSVHFVDEMTGYAAGDSGVIMKSVDGANGNTDLLG